MTAAIAFLLLGATLFAQIPIYPNQGETMPKIIAAYKGHNVEFDEQVIHTANAYAYSKGLRPFAVTRKDRPVEEKPRSGAPMSLPSHVNLRILEFEVADEFASAFAKMLTEVPGLDVHGADVATGMFAEPDPVTDETPAEPTSISSEATGAVQTGGLASSDTPAPVPLPAADPAEPATAEASNANG